MFVAFLLLVIVNKTYKLSDYLHIRMLFIDFQGLSRSRLLHLATEIEAPVEEAVPGEFTGNLCTMVTLHITVTWPFPKSDRYIHVGLYRKETCTKMTARKSLLHSGGVSPGFICRQTSRDKY